MSEQPEKPKNDEKMKNDQQGVEWSFDFADLGNSIRGFFSDLAGEAELETSNFVVPNVGVETATIRVDYSVGQGFLKASDGTNLFEADITHIGELEFSADGDAHKHIILKQRNKVSNNVIKQGFRAMSNNDALRWDVGIAPAVPVRLDIDGGVGPTDLNLTGLTVESLDMDAGIGAVTLMLPAQNAHFEAEIDGGVGQTMIYAPENIDAMLNIEGGVGAIEIFVPANTAVRLEGESGVGSINVPPTMKGNVKREFIETQGVWQSEGFELAERKLVIYYEGGVGQLTIRETEMV